MARLTPAYRERRPDPVLEAEARYQRLLARDERRRLVAVLMAHHWHPEPPRPRWIGLAIDYAATPALVALVAGLLAAGHWWIAPATALHLATLYGLLRWDARSGPG